MATLNRKDVEGFREHGYHVARGVFGRDEIARLREGYDYILELASRTDLPDEILNGRRRDVHIHLQTPGPMTGPDAVRYLRKVQWPALVHPAFEEIRNSPKFPALLAPLIGTTLKQFINQINFKMPGGKIEFPWHQDVRPTPAFRDQVNNYVQTIVVVDPGDRRERLSARHPGKPQAGQPEGETIREGKRRIEQVDVSSAVPCEAMPGDVLMFTSFTVHGSSPNTTDGPRRSYINGFVRASACDVGRWAFLDGKPVPVTSDYDYHAIRYKRSTP